MNQSSLLGSIFQCQCGRQHKVPTKRLHFSDNALGFLDETISSLGNHNSILVVADQRTLEVAGREVVRMLNEASYEVDIHIVPDDEGESPVADDLTKDSLMARAPQADLYIAVGSGVVNDLVKWVAYLREKPYLVVATAASMNGYASANVAATIDGLKVLFHAQACQAVFACPEVIINAPHELTTSGLGDVLAKSVSSADWKLNQFLFDDYYCQFSVDLLKDLEPVYLNNPQKIRNKDPEAYQALFEALFYSSIAMTITGTSSPASGGEHLISHTIDMLAGRDFRKHDLHGRQVGVASILMAALYEKIMDIEEPEFCEVPENIDLEFWGSLAKVVQPEYRKKLPKIRQAAAFLSVPKNWENLRSLIKPKLIQAFKLKNCLLEAGAAHRYSDIRDNDESLKHSKFLEVVNHANQMRERFTILDLAVMLGIIPNQIEQLIEEWVTG